MATTGPNVRPGEKPPELPAVARTMTRVGAAEFARFWFRALDWGYATTDSTLARTLYLPACSDCARFMKNFDDTKAEGEHFRGGRSVPSAIEIAGSDQSHPNATAVDVRLEVAKLQLVSRAGHVEYVTPAVHDLHYRTWVSWDGTGWKVIDLKQVVDK